MVKVTSLRGGGGGGGGGWMASWMAMVLLSLGVLFFMMTVFFGTDSTDTLTLSTNCRMSAFQKWKFSSIIFFLLYINHLIYHPVSGAMVTSYILQYIRARLLFAIIRGACLCLRVSIVKWRSGYGFEDGAPLYWIMH